MFDIFSQSQSLETQKIVESKLVKEALEVKMWLLIKVNAHAKVTHCKSSTEINIKSNS